MLAKLEKVPVYGGQNRLEEGSRASEAFKAQNVSLECAFVSGHAGSGFRALVLGSPGDDNEFARVRHDALLVSSLISGFDVAPFSPSRPGWHMPWLVWGG